MLFICYIMGYIINWSILYAYCVCVSEICLSCTLYNGQPLRKFTSEICCTKYLNHTKEMLWMSEDYHTVTE